MHRIIIDTDGGVDDALALLFALACQDARVEAITTVHGNVPVEQATANVLEVLHIAGCARMVAQGCMAPLSGVPVFARDVHGAEGLGGWAREQRGEMAVLSDLSAPALITSLARQSPGEITLVTIGPLTNAAVALREDPEGFRMLRRMVTMGGAVFERGNVTTTAEFNFYADPHAAREVVRSGVPMTLVGLDVTHKVVSTQDRMEQLLAGECGTRERFLRCICERMLSFYRPRIGADQFFLHDPLAVGVALDPSLAGTRAMQVDIETAGELTRGMVVAERRPWAQTATNVDVCVDVDAECFLAQFARLIAAS